MQEMYAEKGKRAQSSGWLSNFIKKTLKDKNPFNMQEIYLERFSEGHSVLPWSDCLPLQSCLETKHTNP